MRRTLSIVVLCLSFLTGASCEEGAESFANVTMEYSRPETADCDQRRITVLRVENTRHKKVLDGDGDLRLQPGSYVVFFRIVLQQKRDGRCEELEVFQTQPPYAYAGRISVEAGRSYKLKLEAADRLGIEEVTVSAGTEGPLHYQ